MSIPCLAPWFEKWKHCLNDRPNIANASTQHFCRAKEAHSKVTVQGKAEMMFSGSLAGSRIMKSANAANSACLKMALSSSYVTGFSGFGKNDSPSKPRKTPLSAYQLFVKERVEEMKTESDQKPVEMFRKAASEWQNLKEQEKDRYRDRSDAEKEVWMRECAKYEAFLDSLSEVERTRLKMKELLLKASAKERKQLTKKSVDDVADKMPKRPGGPFQLFFNEQLQCGGFEGLKGPELFQAAGEKWKSLSEQEKKKFSILRKQLQKQYAEDLEAWKKS